VPSTKIVYSAGSCLTWLRARVLGRRK